MLKAGDCVVVTHHGQEATGNIDCVKAGTAHVDLESKIDGFLQVLVPITSLRPAPVA